MNDLGLPHSVYFPLLKSFVDSLALRMEEIKKALQGKNAEETKRLAHQLRGTAATFGYPVIASAAQALEESADTDKIEHPDTIKTYEELDFLCREVPFSFANNALIDLI